MNRIRTWHWALGAVVLFIVAFWVGIATHFPGAALSRFLEGMVNRDPRIAVHIAPAELHWNRISIPEIRVDGVVDGRPAFLAAFRESEIPLSLGLFGGFSLRTALAPAGDLALTWPWKNGQVSFSGRGIRLETIPAVALIRPPPKKPGRMAPAAGLFSAERVKGRMEFEGEMTVLDGVVTDGQLRGQIDGLEVGGASVMGFGIATTEISDARFQIALGPVIRVQSFTVQGDFQGTIGGSVTPRLNRIEASPLDIQVDVTVRPEWTQQLGPLAPLLNNFFDAGRLTGTLRGTPARPVFRPTRSRG
jgi:hypothetical protein